MENESFADTLTHLAESLAKHLENEPVFAKRCRKLSSAFRVFKVIIPPLLFFKVTHTLSKAAQANFRRTGPVYSPRGYGTALFC